MTEITSIKVVLVGDASVGKTSIVSKFVSGNVPTNPRATIGSGCQDKTVNYKGKDYVLNIWDTAGQETYRNLVPMYFRGAQVAIIVVDMTLKKSLQSVDYWIKQVNEYSNGSMSLILVANKVDLTEKYEYGIEAVEEFANKYDIPYVQTSAVTGVGIDSVFEKVIFLAQTANNPVIVNHTNQLNKGNRKCC